MLKWRKDFFVNFLVFQTALMQLKFMKNFDFVMIEKKIQLFRSQTFSISDFDLTSIKEKYSEGLHTNQQNIFGVGMAFISEA